MSRAKLYFLASALVLVGLAGASGYLFKTLGDTEAVLADTRRQLATSEAAVVEEKRLSGVANQTANDRIAALGAELGAANAEVAVKRRQLEASNATVEKQKADVAAFQKCLDGVTGAVVSASNRNTGEAETILNGAKGDCDRAYAVG